MRALDSLCCGRLTVCELGLSLLELLGPDASQLATGVRGVVVVWPTRRRGHGAPLLAAQCGVRASTIRLAVLDGESPSVHEPPPRGDAGDGVAAAVSCGEVLMGIVQPQAPKILQRRRVQMPAEHVLYGARSDMDSVGDVRDGDVVGGVGLHVLDRAAQQHGTMIGAV